MIFNKKDVLFLKSFDNPQLTEIADKIQSLLPVEVEPKWLGKLMYKPKGLYPRWHVLGEFVGDYKSAQEKAKIFAQNWMKENLDENRIDEWDVRIGPV